MNKFYYLTKAIFENGCSDENKLQLIHEIQSCDLLVELLPYLLHHRIVGQFYILAKNYSLITILNKEFWRVVTKLICYEYVKTEELLCETKVLCDRLSDEKIKYAVLKGIHLKSFIYGQYYPEVSRMSNDIDILIERKDIVKVNNILLEMKYFRGEYDPDSDKLKKYSRKEEIEFLLTSHQCPQYIKQSSRKDVCINDVLAVDVNLSIFEGGKKVNCVDTNELLNNVVRRKDWKGHYYNALTLEYDLLQIVYHFYKDTNYKIKKDNNEQYLLCHMVDIYQYIKQYGNKIDFSLFCSICERAKVIDKVQAVFVILNTWISSDFISAYILWSEKKGFK